MQNPSGRPLVSVVILNWNGLHFLQRYLPLVIQHSQGAEIVVADNASTDDSLKWVIQHHPSVRIITMKANTGFAGGYNLALKEVNSDFYVLLNSDVEVTANWIDPVLQRMKNDPSIAACQPKIRSWSDRALL